jgi:ubiquinol oxidase
VSRSATPIETIAVGPIGTALGERPPFGPIRRLDSQALRAAQVETLAALRRQPWAPSNALFAVMDVAYGRARTLEKFRVLELVARVPYQAWENVAYVAVTHTARRPGFARRVFDTEGGTSQGLVRRQVIPQILAFVYYWISWVLFVVRPGWSYRLNADFEEHAEHEYAQLVAEHPEWETTRFHSAFADDFGSYDSLADVFRQIGFDERLHKEQSDAMRAATTNTGRFAS